MEYLAHRDADGGRTQTVLSHLTGVSQLAAEFGAAFCAAEEGSFCGLLHDIGKYSDAFQRRINGSPEQVDHSTAGAFEAARRGNVPAAFCIAGHHGGLPDGGSPSDGPDRPTLHGRLNRAQKGGIERYDAFAGQIAPPAAGIPKRFVQTPAGGLFFTRMLYSCLVDADFLDTERFMQNGRVERGDFPHGEKRERRPGIAGAKA